MTRFNHAFDFAFEVISNDEQADDVTTEMLIAACRKRLDAIEAAGGSEMLQACQCLDTMEVSK